MPKSGPYLRTPEEHAHQATVLTHELHELSLKYDKHNYFRKQAAVHAWAGVGAYLLLTGLFYFVYGSTNYWGAVFVGIAMTIGLMTDHARTVKKGPWTDKDALRYGEISQRIDFHISYIPDDYEEPEQ